MTILTQKRPMSHKEREYLEGLLKSAATGAKRFAEGAENALVVWAGSLLVFVIAWISIAWLVWIIFDVEFGLKSLVAIWILSFGAPVCALFAIVSTIRWMRDWQNDRPLLQLDLETGQVNEEYYRFTEVKRFQEPEHGGLIYFLRTAEDEVLVLYDYDSPHSADNDENRISNSFRPHTEFVIVRAPSTGYIISQEFSGTPLDAGKPYDLDISPKLWPESDSLCNIPWNELEERLSVRSL